MYLGYLQRQCKMCILLHPYIKVCAEVTLALLCQFSPIAEVLIVKIGNEFTNTTGLELTTPLSHIRHEIGAVMQPSRHQRRKYECCSPNSLRPISYFWSICFRHKNQSFLQEKEPATLSHGQWTHSAKIVLIVWPEIPQMPHKISAQFVCPSPKVLNF